MADGPGLFGRLEAAGLVPEAVADAAVVRAMLRTEAAIAAAQAGAGLVPAEHARLIDAVCRGPAPRPDELGEAALSTGTPVVPLLDALRTKLPADVGPSLHRGVTSQDIVDTATMLTASGAVRLILADLERAATTARELARAHASTPMAGRTLLQHARPITFGAKAAGWRRVLEAAMGGLHRVRDERLAVQLGGPVGTMEGLGAKPEWVVAAVARELGLSTPDAPWHADRTRLAELAAALGVAGAAIGKVALDLVLLAQTEVAEVTDRDPTRGGSSSMPHKRNPIAAVLARAAAARTPGLVANLLAAASNGEHERAAGAWHAEWASLRELLLANGSGAAWLRDALDGLGIDEDRMRRNLELTSGLGDVASGIEAAARLADQGAARPVPSTARPVTVHHRLDGPAGAPVVVLSNSLGSSLEMWDPVVAGLSDRFRVVRYDLRGHGRSPTPPGPYTMDDLAADLIALLDEIGSERISLAGVSIGGMASLAVAARAPERVERLVVIGSSARLGPVRAWVERSRTALLDGLAPIAEVVTPRWVSGTFAASHPEAMSRYREMFSAADPAGYAGCCIAIAGMDLTDELARIAAPTLVVVGSDDPATPPEHSRAIAATVPRARLVTLDGGAHLPSLERPDEIVSLMVEHLS